MTAIVPSVRRLDYHYFAMQIGFWAMFAGICCYQTALLQERGFSNSQIGIIIAVRCVAGILCQPMLGGFADRHPEIPLKWMISASLCISLIAGLAFFFVSMGMGGVLVIFFLMGGFEISAYPFIDSMAIQYINVGVPIRYGLGRGIGSLTYALTAVLLGFVVARRGVEATLPIHAVLVVAEIAVIALFPTFCARLGQEDNIRPKPQSVCGLLHANPKFTLMLIALFFGLTALIPLSNFLVVIIIDRGGTTSNLGFALFLMASSELPVAFVFPRLYKRFGSTRLLLVSVSFATLKAILLLLSGNLAAVLLIQPLQMFSYGLFVQASVFFVNDTVPREDMVRGQTLMMVASNGMGGVAGNLLAGRVLDLGGVNAMLAFCAACGCVGILLSWLAISTKQAQNKNI